MYMCVYIVHVNFKMFNHTVPDHMYETCSMKDVHLMNVLDSFTLENGRKNAIIIMYMYLLYCSNDIPAQH